MATINYTSRLHSTAADGKLAHASEIFDEVDGRFQGAINKDVKAKLNALSSAYRIKGTIDSFNKLLTLTPVIGDVYNITNEFTLSGKKYPAGTNVVAVNNVKGESSWDALGGTIDVQGILKSAASDATSKANTAKSEAISAAASDATSKANTAKSEAISAAANDATNKANTAKSEAISAAASDATSKANTAKSEAISAAASDATNKANTAKSEAISAAASDATSKANVAESRATKASTHLEGKLIKFTRIVPGKKEIIMQSPTSDGEIVYLPDQEESSSASVLYGNGFYTLYQGKYYRGGSNLPVGIAGKTPNTFAQDAAGNLYIGVDGKRLEKIEVLNDFKAKTATAQSTADAAKSAAATADGKAATAQSTANAAKSAAATADGKAVTAQSTAEAAKSAAATANNAISDLAKTVSDYNELRNRVAALENLLKLA